MINWLLRMKPREMERWERTRKAGKWRFILVDGLLAIGLTCALVVTLMVLGFGWYHQKEPWTFEIPLLFGIMLLNGVLTGFTVWYCSEWLYSQMLNKGDHGRA